MLRLALPGGAAGRLSVLIFHRVLRQPDPLLPEETDAAYFDWQMRIVKSCFNVLPLSEAVERLSRGSLPPRALCITFDDGYADNHEVALPILQRYGLPATFFVATGFLDGGRMWNDSIIEAIRRATGDAIDLEPLGLGRHPIGTAARRQAATSAVIRQIKYRPLQERLDLVAALADRAGVSLPTDLMMSSLQVRSLQQAGMEIGAHTANHPILARLSREQARTEIVAGRESLEELTGIRVTLFAYPNGRPGEDYLPEHVRLVGELGFAAAFTTSCGAARCDSDRLQLPRFGPWDRTAARYLVRLGYNGATRGREVHEGAR